MGTRLVFVGSGTVPQAAEFKHETGAQLVLTDPDLVVYASLGMTRSVWRTIAPRTWPGLGRAFRRGARQRSVQGSPFQMGGVLVVAPAGQVVWIYRSRWAGDHPTSAEVISAVGAAHAAPEAPS